MRGWLGMVEAKPQISQKLFWVNSFYFLPNRTIYQNCPGLVTMNLISRIFPAWCLDETMKGRKTSATMLAPHDITSTAGLQPWVSERAARRRNQGVLGSRFRAGGFSKLQQILRVLLKAQSPREGREQGQEAGTRGTDKHPPPCLSWKQRQWHPGSRNEAEWGWPRASGSCWSLRAHLWAPQFPTP